MNSKHRRTLLAVFAEPVSGAIRWADIESLFNAAGCAVIEGKGSAVKFSRAGVVGYFHRPHPGKEAKKYQVTNARTFLTKLGVKP
jgi:hypothetical protein